MDKAIAMAIQKGIQKNCARDAVLQVFWDAESTEWKANQSCIKAEEKKRNNREEKKSKEKKSIEARRKAHVECEFNEMLIHSEIQLGGFL